MDQTVTSDAITPMPTRRGISRFLRNIGAMFGIVYLILMVAMSVLAPRITPGVTPDTRFYQLPLGENGPSTDQFPARLFGNETPGIPYYQKSVLAQVTYGGWPTLLIGLVTALVTAIIGTVLGAIAGYFSGWVDELIMRITDIGLALPFLPLAVGIIIATQQLQGVLSLIILFSLVGWVTVARQVRALYLTMREQAYTEAARATGVNDLRIIFRHLLPIAIGPILVTTVLNAASFVAAEATLDFLSIGVSRQVTWGGTIAEGINWLFSGNWWWSFFPGLLLSLTILSINFIAEGLRDVLDVTR